MISRTCGISTRTSRARQVTRPMQSHDSCVYSAVLCAGVHALVASTLSPQINASIAVIVCLRALPLPAPRASRPSRPSSLFRCSSLPSHPGTLPTPGQSPLHLLGCRAGGTVREMTSVNILEGRVSQSRHSCPAGWVWQGPSWAPGTCSLPDLCPPAATNTALLGHNQPSLLETR